MQENDEKLIKIPELQALLGGVGRSTIWRYSQGLGPAGFPKRIFLTKRSVAFKRSEVMAFLNNLGQQAG